MYTHSVCVFVCAPQYTGETLGQAERTEFDANLEGLLALAETTKAWTDLIIAQTEVLLQPNPGESNHMPLSRVLVPSWEDVFRWPVCVVSLLI